MFSPAVLCVFLRGSRCHPQKHECFTGCCVHPTSFRLMFQTSRRKIRPKTKMATDGRVRSCLQDLAKLDMEIKALIQDIRDSVTTTEALTDINTLARQKINQLRRKIEDLERFGREEIKVAARTLILTDVDRHKNSLTSTVQMMRQVNISTQLKLDRQAKDELISGSPVLRHRTTNTKQSLVKSAGTVTESLRSISSLLSEQVDRSRDTVTTLVSSSKVVGDTQEEFRTMGGQIQSSRKLLTKYGRRELTDKLVIILAVLFFFACVLYIVKKRIWT